ncbi:LOW QUALITY PROTEIN: thioredoxin-like protein 1 [Manduca sexta]|uniref:LOW QUALITY PROTEIN: thioredoxin-like protein 1 n=1 Tax=Manduca sexta TaxID=7130 RepID=UPI00188EECB9|nr:LOW QUALITY PROTEIN: thioredoxin-like protein 1 [Manduca sexta]
MGLATVIENEAHFQSEMANAGTKLVVVDFTATWCPPCQRIAPFFEQLPAKFPRAVFLKVDVDRCAETAGAQGISAMPTFIFYRNRTRIDRLQGADSATLENKVRQYYGTETEEAGDEDNSVAGHMDLVTFITKNECECLNEADDHPLAHALTAGRGYLASDCDAQLIINVSFNQVVKLHSLKIKAPADKGPKFVKLFINQPRTLDFEQASRNVSVQDVEFTPSDLEGKPVPLKFVKFQTVQNIQLFISDNQGSGDVTQIDHLAFYGSPISTTNMGEFKRVAGKKGESH